MFTDYFASELNSSFHIPADKSIIDLDCSVMEALDFAIDPSPEARNFQI